MSARSIIESKLIGFRRYIKILTKQVSVGAFTNWIESIPQSDPHSQITNLIWIGLSRSNGLDFIIKFPIQGTTTIGNAILRTLTSLPPQYNNLSLHGLHPLRNNFFFIFVLI